MGEPFRFPAIVEPDTWNVCFHRTAASRLWGWLACGKYKHVSAFAFIPGSRHWLLYDVHFEGTRLAILPDTPAAFQVIEAIISDCDVIRITRQTGRAHFVRLGFWCVPAVKHLLGLRSSALRPDALFRHLLRDGGEIIGQAGSAANPARPAVRAAAAGSGAG